MNLIKNVSFPVVGIPNFFVAIMAWKLTIEKRSHPVQPDAMLYEEDFERELKEWQTQAEVKKYAVQVVHLLIFPLRECVQSIRFVFQSLAHYNIFKAKPSLKVLNDQVIIEKYLHVMKVRGNGPIRIYKLLLAILKAVNFVTKGMPAQDSPRAYLEKEVKEYQRKKKQHQNNQSLNQPKYPLLTALQYDNVREKCQLFLAKAVTLPGKEQMSKAKLFMDHLILMTLVSVAPPRHQVFSLLEERHLIWRAEENAYELQMDGVDPPLKCGHPVLLLLTEELSVFYKLWVEKFRSLYLKERTSSFLFPNSLGGRATKLSPALERLTMKYIGVVIPISKFRYAFLWLHLICHRNSTVTIFAQKPEWSEALASELAEQMGHSVAVQKKFYKRVSILSTSFFTCKL